MLSILSLKNTLFPCNLGPRKRQCIVEIVQNSQDLVNFLGYFLSHSVGLLATVKLRLSKFS